MAARGDVQMRATKQHRYDDDDENAGRLMRRSNWKGSLALALVGLMTTVVSGYYSGLAAIGDRDRAQIERVGKLEERVENHYKAIMARLDDQAAREETNRQDARADVNAIRDEIMRMLREMRR